MTLLRRTRPASPYFGAGLFAEDHTPTVRESFFATTAPEPTVQRVNDFTETPVGTFYLGGSFPRTHVLIGWGAGRLQIEVRDLGGSLHSATSGVDAELAHADKMPPDDGNCRDHHAFAAQLRKAMERLELASMPPIQGGSGDFATAEPGMAADVYDEIADQFHSGDDEFDPSPLNWSLVSPSVLPPDRRAAWDVAFAAGEYCEVRQKISTPPAGFDAMEREAFRRGMARERARGEMVEFAAEAIRAFEDFGVVDPEAKSCPSCFETLGSSDGPLCWSCRADRDEAEATKLRRGPSAVDLAWAAGYEAAKASESPVRAPSHYTPGEAEAFDAGCDAYGAEWAEEMALRAEADLEMSLSPEDRAEAGLMPAKGVHCG